ncbi:MAG: transposase [Verrucomicrobiales bacterium]|nr:transposase [Verrucomicrobiales bacterium]
MDGQSVKNSAELKGYDAGKKVSGIKRHPAVDTQGLPHGIVVTTANLTDRGVGSFAPPPCADGQNHAGRRRLHRPVLCR